jgi:hypothetical protein
MGGAYITGIKYIIGPIYVWPSWTENNKKMLLRKEA